MTYSTNGNEANDNCVCDGMPDGEKCYHCQTIENNEWEHHWDEDWHE